MLDVGSRQAEQGLISWGGGGNGRLPREGQCELRPQRIPKAHGERTSGRSPCMYQNRAGKEHYLPLCEASLPSCTWLPGTHC